MRYQKWYLYHNWEPVDKNYGWRFSGEPPLDKYPGGEMLPGNWVRAINSVWFWVY